jgi:hypothetical protein
MTLLPWFRLQERISRKTLRPACLITWQWRCTVEGVQISGDLEAVHLSCRTWLLQRRKSLYLGRPVGEERRLVFLSLFVLPPSVGVLGTKLGSPFITQGDTTVAKVHVRQMSSNFGWWHG